MKTLDVVTNSLRFHWRIHAAVALGVAAATAVLAGALIVGDSVRGSLRSLTLDRLGRIDQVMILDRFFRRKMATELAERMPQARVAPAIVFPSATVQTADTSGRRLASGVLVVASEASWWQLAPAT